MFCKFHEVLYSFLQDDDGDPPSDGAYIMHNPLVNGSQPNNDRFSDQSIGYMNPVIGDRGQGTGTACISACIVILL